MGIIMEDNNKEQIEVPADITVYKKEEVKEEPPSPLDVHAGFFQMYAPRFRAHLEQLNSKALRRIINYLIVYPLNDNEVKLVNDLEKDTFLLGNRLLESKYNMKLGLISEEIISTIVNQAKKHELIENKGE